MTISQEIEQRSIMVTFSAGQIVGEPDDLQTHDDLMQPSEVMLAITHGNIQTEQRDTKMLSPYRAFPEPQHYEGIIRPDELPTMDNDTPIAIIQQLGCEGNGNVNETSMHPLLLQSKIFEQSKETLGHPLPDDAGHFITRDIVEGPFNQEIRIVAKIDEIYENESNLLIATEKSITEPSEQVTLNSSTLIQGDNNKLAMMEPSNMAMMVQHRPIAPAHASPVVYAEAANTAILSSSAVHHQVYTEDVSNNNNSTDNDENTDTHRDILKEHALTHGYESGV